VGVGEGRKGKTTEFQAALIPRELYWGKSEVSVSGDGNDNSAHCEGRQERSWEHIGLQRLGPVFLAGLCEKVLCSVPERSRLLGFEFGFVALRALFLQRLQGGKTAYTVGIGKAPQVFLRQEGPVWAAQL
jgi:hypothetical protein